MATSESELYSKIRHDLESAIAAVEMGIYGLSQDTQPSARPVNLIKDAIRRMREIKEQIQPFTGRKIETVKV